MDEYVGSLVTILILHVNTGEGTYSIVLILIKDRKPVKLAQDSLGDEEAHACANLTL